MECQGAKGRQVRQTPEASLAVKRKQIVNYSGSGATSLGCFEAMQHGEEGGERVTAERGRGEGGGEVVAMERGEETERGEGKEAASVMG